MNVRLSPSSGSVPPSPFGQPSFQWRVGEFWRRFSEAADELRQMIQQQAEGDVVMHKLLSITRGTLDGIGCGFGPGEDGGHAFEVTPEGNDHVRLALFYWASQAPPLPGWSFFPTKRPSKNLKSGALELFGHRLSPVETWVTVTPDDESQMFTVVMWHPVFGKVSEEAKWAVASAWLDEAIGEEVASARVKSFVLSDAHLRDAIAFTELRAFMEQEVLRREWEPQEPGRTWKSVELILRPPPPFDVRDFTSKADVLTLALDTRVRDPLAHLGATYLWVRTDLLYMNDNLKKILHDLPGLTDAALAQHGVGTRVALGMAERAFFQVILAWNGEAAMDLLLEIYRAVDLNSKTTVTTLGASRVTMRLV